jgi:hypothetical protein
MTVVVLCGLARTQVEKRDEYQGDHAGRAGASLVLLRGGTILPSPHHTFRKSAWFCPPTGRKTLVFLFFHRKIIQY